MMATLFESFQVLFNEYNLIFNKICLNQGYDDLTVSNYQYLYSIYCLNKATITRLSEALSIKKSSVTNMIEVLSEKGYVQREPSVDDRRSTIISLTNKGIKIVELEEKVQRAFVDEMKQVVNDDEMEHFSYLLNKMASTIVKRQEG